MPPTDVSVKLLIKLSNATALAVQEHGKHKLAEVTVANRNMIICFKQPEGFINHSTSFKSI